MVTNRNSLSGYTQYPLCSQAPQVVLATIGMKACLECAFKYMRGIAPLVDTFTIFDGELNAQAKAAHLTRPASIARQPAPPPEQEGGRSGDKPIYADRVSRISH